MLNLICSIHIVTTFFTLFEIVACRTVSFGLISSLVCNKVLLHTNGFPYYHCSKCEYYYWFYNKLFTFYLCNNINTLPFLSWVI